MSSADTAKRRKRVEQLFVIRGLPVAEIVSTLRSEGLLTTKSPTSAERLVRKDCAQIADDLPPAKAAQASPLACARYIRRNEALFDRLMDEFEQREGVTVTTMTYPNGNVMEIERRADRGGLRIRAAELALRCADTLAKVEGVAAMLARGAEDGDDAAGKTADQPRLRILPPDPARLTAEQRKRLADRLRRSHPAIAEIYDSYVGADDAAESGEPLN
jgi:hypothetical protein